MESSFVKHGYFRLVNSSGDVEMMIPQEKFFFDVQTRLDTLDFMRKRRCRMYCCCRSENVARMRVDESGLSFYDDDGEAEHTERCLEGIRGLSALTSNSDIIKSLIPFEKNVNVDFKWTFGAPGVISTVERKDISFLSMQTLSFRSFVALVNIMTFDSYAVGNERYSRYRGKYAALCTSLFYSRLSCFCLKNRKIKDEKKRLMCFRQNNLYKNMKIEAGNTGFYYGRIEKVIDYTTEKELAEGTARPYVYLVLELDNSDRATVRMPRGKYYDAVRDLPQRYSVPGGRFLDLWVGGLVRVREVVKDTAVGKGFTASRPDKYKSVYALDVPQAETKIVRDMFCACIFMANCSGMMMLDERERIFSDFLIEKGLRIYRPMSKTILGNSGLEKYPLMVDVPCGEDMTVYQAIDRMNVDVERLINDRSYDIG